MKKRKGALQSEDGLRISIGAAHMTDKKTAELTILLPYELFLSYFTKYRHAQRIRSDKKLAKKFKLSRPFQIWIYNHNHGGNTSPQVCIMPSDIT